MPRIPLWVDLREVPVKRRVPFQRAAKAAKAEAIIVGKDDPHAGDDGFLVIDGRGTLKRKGKPIGRLVAVHKGTDQKRAAEAKSIIIVDATDWTIIPLENLIAARRDRPGTLYALARTPEEAGLFRDTLEVGVHGIVLQPTSPEAIRQAASILESKGVPEQAAAAEDRPFLEPATVIAMDDAGPGDRVCVDTTSVFHAGEGLLIGSTARAFALVHAETIETDYVRARPFRVNAGAVHSYVIGADGKTNYLSELAAGSRVTAVQADSKTRTVTVGRAKIERRPHTLVVWETDAGQGSAVLQTAETVRLVGPKGEPIAITDLRPGDQILVHTESAARHFGMPVDEHLEER